MTRISAHRLSELLLPKQVMFSIKPFDIYKQIKLRVKHQGVELRGYKKGSEIGSKQYLAKKGQFIISKIDARNGSMGIVPESLDNAIVTGDFLLYEFNESLIRPLFFDYICRTPAFDSFCKKCSEGSTNRVRLKVDRFLNLLIDLPSIEIQEKIVDKIEKVKSNIDEISTLRSSQAKDIDNLLFSKYTDIIENAEWLPMKVVAPIVRRQVVVKEDALYPELGIRCFGKGTFHKTPLTGAEVATKKIFQIKAGDLVFSNVFAWEGAIAVAKEDDDNRYGSHRFISCVADEEKALTTFLCYHFLSSKGLEDIIACSPGGAGRNKTLGLDKLMKITIPVPTLELQREFVDLLERTNAIKEHYKQTEYELMELIPSLLDKAFKGELFSNNSVQMQNEISKPVQKVEVKLPLPAPYKNDDLELAMIVALIESKLGNTYGEVGIQKTVFNIEAFNPALSRKYNFVNYHFGTYSAELKECIKSNPLLGKKLIKGNEVFTISPAHKKTVFDAISYKANADFVLAVNKLLEVYTSPFIGKHTDKIELLNTVTKLIIDLQTSDVNIIYEGMKKWNIQQQGFKTKADKFDITNTSKTIDLLISNELIKKLLA